MQRDNALAERVERLAQDEQQSGASGRQVSEMLAMARELREPQQWPPHRVLPGL